MWSKTFLDYVKVVFPGNCFVIQSLHQIYHMFFFCLCSQIFMNNEACLFFSCTWKLKGRRAVLSTKHNSFNPSLFFFFRYKLLIKLETYLLVFIWVHIPNPYSEPIDGMTKCSGPNVSFVQFIYWNPNSQEDGDKILEDKKITLVEYSKRVLIKETEGPLLVPFNFVRS